MPRSLTPPILLLLLTATSAAVASPDDLRRREVEIESALVARLGDDARSIRVVAIERHVILVGTVATRVTEEMAKEVALSLAGVEKVSNRLVARNDPTLLDGQILLEGKDAELEIAVKRAVLRDAGESVARAIEIEAVDGVVSLRGAAPDATGREKALAAASNVPGVLRVLDLVRAAR